MNLKKIHRPKAKAGNILNLLLYLFPIVLLTLSMESAFSQKGSFVIQITFVDTETSGPSSVSLFVKEYPEFSTENIDLMDAMYDDDPDTSDGKYTTRLSLPSGLIDTGDSFKVCMKDEDENKVTKCYSMKNGPEKEPEKLNIAV